MSIRPLARTIVLGLVGVVCVLIGWAVDSPVAAGIGIMLVMAILIDAIRFLTVEAREPLVALARSAHPNPCSVGESITVRLAPDRGREADASLEETLPSELSSHVIVRPPEARSAALTYEVAPPRRGQWILGPCFVIRFSSLGLWWAKIAAQSTNQITAWPRTVPLGMPALTQDREGLVGQRGYVQPHQDNTTVRTYNPGDDLRRVHWRSSARQGELMTRAEEPTDSDHAWVGLWVPTATVSPRRELAISLAASWAVEMASEGYTVDMACGGETHHGTAHSHLTHLAQLNNTQAGKPLPTTPPEGVALLVIARASTRTIPAGSVVQPSQGHHHTKAIAVVLSDSESDAQIVSAAGWSVLRLDDGTSLEKAADNLARFAQSLEMAGVG